MSSEPANPRKPDDISSKDQLGMLFRPKNILRIVASQVPIAAAGVEILNQIDGQRMDSRVASLEQTDAAVLAKLHKLENSAVKAPPPALVEWPIAVTEFLRRNIEFAIVYRPPDDPQHEFVLPVANGCLVGNDYVLTSSEALAFAMDGAKLKRGRLVILFNLCWFDFQAEPTDTATGLVLCKITKRDESTYQEARRIFKKGGVDLWVDPPTKLAPKWTITPWLGQECGFLVPSDSDNNSREMEWTPVEFGTSVISHFRLPKDNALKVFVTAPYAGRIAQAGSAVFGRDGTLLGIISEVERYEYDAGRRAVVKTLLGFPRFTTPKLKPNR